MTKTTKFKGLSTLNKDESEASDIESARLGVLDTIARQSKQQDNAQIDDILDSGNFYQTESEAASDAPLSQPLTARDDQSCDLSAVKVHLPEIEDGVSEGLPLSARGEAISEPELTAVKVALPETEDEVATEEIA